MNKLNPQPKTSTISSWLDSCAVGMSLICAIHCMITPVLLLLLPILASTFWTHRDFHLWMLFLVLPTTLTAILIGYRKHNDKTVLALGLFGLMLLIGVAGYESFFHSTSVKESLGCSHCSHCSLRGHNLHTSTWLNLVGTVFLISSHIRNYILRRKSQSKNFCCNKHTKKKTPQLL